MVAVARTKAPWKVYPQAVGEGWEHSLPHLLGDEIDREALESFSRDLSQDLPEAVYSQVIAALDSVFSVASEPREALVARLMTPEGDSIPLLLEGHEVRIGRGPSCHVQIPADEIAEEHCELRQGAGGWSVVCLGQPPGTRWNGQLLPANEPQELRVNDELLIAGFRIVFGGPAEVEKEPTSVRFAGLSGHWRRAESSPFLHFGTVDDHWIAVRVSDWRGFVKLPESWIGWTYSALGFDPPEAAIGFHNEIDRSIALFVLSQLASSLRQSLGQPVEIGSISKGAVIGTETDPEQLGFIGANFDVSVGGSCRETCVVWPVRNPVKSPSLSQSAWAEEVLFTVPILAGFTLLSLSDFHSLEPGDVIFPDRWLPRSEDATAPLAGNALAFLQNQVRMVELMVTDAGCELQFSSSSWDADSQGVNMLSDQADGQPTEPAAQDPTRPSGRGLEDELQVAVTFELDRLTVTLAEVKSWDSGMTISLARRPEEPVKIVLQHAGGERRLGTGRVVVVDGELGIQIEEWDVEDSRGSL